MFKAARWRSEKNKIKVVFKLEFHATQVTKLGWETAMVSLVPLDVGKPTTRTEKVTVMDGNCEWRKSIYEAVKLIQDPKTGKIGDKLYSFVVSATGSTRAAVIGEVTINLSKYVEVLKPSSVSLPLKASDTGPILHVTIQRVQDDVQRREADENGETWVRDQELKIVNQLKVIGAEAGCKSLPPNANSTEVQIRFPSNKAMHMQAGASIKHRKSDSADSTDTMSIERSSGEYVSRENGTKSYYNHNSYFNVQSPFSSSSTPQYDSRDHRWSITYLSSGPDGSTDGSANSLPEMVQGERLPESAVALVNDVVLEKRREISAVELQTIRRQLVRETKNGQELARELTRIKEERDVLRRECKDLKRSQNGLGHRTVSSISSFDGEDPWSILEETKQELKHEKNVNANLRLQLEKTQESNSELILEVQDLNKALEQERTNTALLKTDTSYDMSDIDIMNGYPDLRVDDCKQEVEMTSLGDCEQYALEELVKRHDVKAAYTLEQQIVNLNNEIELYKKDREDLEMQMEQLALDYEILKQENHGITSRLEQSQFREQLRVQYECSAHSTIISELEDCITRLKNEIEEQAEAFEADLLTLTQAKVLQEQRAIHAEEALRKTRWNNANTAEQLQQEFERLSLQMASTFQMNEKLAMQALAEASELCLQKCQLEELLAETSKELTSVRGQCHVKVQNLTKETNKMLLELKEKSEEFQNLKNYQEARENIFSEEALKLKAEVEKLSGEIVLVSEELGEKRNLVAEMERLKSSIKETEMLLQTTNLERDVLKKDMSSLRKTAEKSVKELHDLQHLKDENEKQIAALNSELATLRAQHNDFKNSLLEDEVEKEKLRKQVFHLRGDLRKKEDAINNIEKKLKESNGRLTLETTKPTVRNKIHSSATQAPKEVANLREKIRLLEGKLKLKDATMEDDKNSYLKKEQDLMNMIEELKKSISEYRADHCGGNAGKEPTTIKKLNGESADEKSSLQSVIAKKLEKSYYKGSNVASDISSNTVTTFEEINDNLMPYNFHQESPDEMSSTVAVLRGKNEAMEVELKEMRERYSEISLKFAEVEGERQQLVMTVRTLKNALKN